MTFVNINERGLNHETVETTPPLSIIGPNPAVSDRTIGVQFRGPNGNVHPLWAGRAGQPQPKVMVYDVRYGERKDGSTVSQYVEFHDASGQNIQLEYDPNTSSHVIGGNGYNLANAELVNGLALRRIYGGERDVPPLRIQVAEGLLTHPDIALSRSLGLEIIGGDMQLRNNNIVIPREPDGSISREFTPVLLSEQVEYKPRKFQLANGPLYCGGLDEFGYQDVLSKLPGHVGTKMWSPNSFDFQSMLKGELTRETVASILPNVDIVTMNAAEARQLGTFLGILEPDLVNLARQYCNSYGLRHMIITADKDPVVSASLNGQVETFQPYAGSQLDCLAYIWGDGQGVVRNATGAGDSFAGGVMTGCDYGLSMEEAIKIGLVSAGAVYCSENSNLSRVGIDQYTDTLAQCIK